MRYEDAAAIFHSCGLQLTLEQYEKLTAYCQALLQANKVMNLTAITDEAGVWHKHFADSAQLLRFLEFPAQAFTLDIGTGAGLPGIVLEIFRPDLQMVLLDSLRKRVDFLEEIVANLRLGAACLHGRAEDFAKLPQYREMFDVVTARAVAPLPVLLEYAVPFVKMGGIFAAMKGPNEQAGQGVFAANALGASPEEIYQTKLPGAGYRQIFVYRKVEKTPPKYPRRGDKIRKSPLLG